VGVVSARGVIIGKRRVVVDPAPAPASVLRADPRIRLDVFLDERVFCLRV
jgi:hypothetical protein